MSETMTCFDCGATWEAEPVKWKGKALISRRYCDPCIAKDDADTEAMMKQNAFSARVSRAMMPRDRKAVPIPAGPVAHLAEQWAAGELPLLVLTGPVGVGKTHLASAACWKALERRSVRWVEVARAMGQLRAAFGDDDRARALSALTGDDSVVLDDLDKLPATEAGLSMIFAAIDTRISAGSPLLITMNNSIDQLAQSIDKKGMGLGQAIASRLHGGKVAKLDGADRRRLKVAA